MDYEQNAGLIGQNLRDLIDECMKFTVDGKPMFKALTYHSAGTWSADYRTWSKEHKAKFRNFADTPERAMADLLDILKKYPVPPSP